MENFDQRLTAASGRVAGYLFFGSLLLHLLVLSQYATTPFFAVHRLDALFHDLFARQLLSGTAPTEPYFRAPLYGWFLAAVYRLFGVNPWAPRLVQSVIGALSVVLLYRFGCRVFSFRVGLIAAIGMALYGPLISNNLELHTPVLEVFLDLAFLGALLGRRGGQAGLLLGISALARPNILVALPLALWFLRRERRTSAVFLAASLLLPLLVTARNFMRSGDSVFIASQGGINFYLGNRAGADGFTPSTPRRYRVIGEYTDSVALYGQRAADEATGQKLTASQSSRYWTKQALVWWRTHPGDALMLTAKKAMLAFSATEIRNNTAFAYLKSAWVPLLWLAPLGFGVIGPLGVLGMALAWREHKRREQRLLTVFCVIYAASFIVFFVADRYRLPLVPLLLLFSAYAATQLPMLVRARRWRPLALLLGLVLLANVDGFSLPRRTWESVDTWSAGNRLIALGNFSEAEVHLQRAVALDPKNGEIWSGLGEALYYQERFADAVQAFTECARLLPENPQPRYNLALCFTALGQAAKARQMLDEALRRDPTYEPARKLQMVH